MNSLIGALVGDAAGATLECYYDPITEEMALAAMRMPGGGVHRVGPGQITDDGELCLSLWRALTNVSASKRKQPNTVSLSGETDGDGELTLATSMSQGITSNQGIGLRTLALWRGLTNTTQLDIDSIQESIAREYALWFASCPFDIGRTCSFAFQILYTYYNPRRYSTPQHAFLGECLESIEQINHGSEANGALMRASAIATWAAAHPTMTAEEAAEIAKADARLSHPNIVCQEVNAIYVFTIKLLLHGVPPTAVIDDIDEYVAVHVTSDKVRKWWSVESLELPKSVIFSAGPLTNPLVGGNPAQLTSCAGHVRWGFVLAMYFLRHPDISYEEAIKRTLMLGGDTDTNAAIVGGLLGAYKPIPEYMLQPVLTFDCVRERPKMQIRPAEFSVGRVITHLL
jgi:ADP-ribosyl-[dinitrogen reductase] hydrolase